MSTAKHTFFCLSISDGFLSEEESNHAIRVLRLKENTAIWLIDGKGNKALAEITVPNKKKLFFEVISKTENQKETSYIHLAIAPTKNMDRFNFFVEKVIEIGINRITPIVTSNSERKVINIDKVRKHAITALKQSGNLMLPIIDELTPFKQFCNTENLNGQKFIAHCEEDQDKTQLKDLIQTEKNVVILIGPEGDFTNEEIILAKQKAFTPVSLGESRLRTETAGIVACHTVHVI